MLTCTARTTIQVTSHPISASMASPRAFTRMHKHGSGISSLSKSDALIWDSHPFKAYPICHWLIAQDAWTAPALVSVTGIAMAVAAMHVTAIGPVRDVTDPMDWTPVAPTTPNNNVALPAPTGTDAHISPTYSAWHASMLDTLPSTVTCLQLRYAWNAT